MNRIQQAVAALLALTITLVGATLATAPLAMAAFQPHAAAQARVRLLVACSTCSPPRRGAVGACDR